MIRKSIPAVLAIICVLLVGALISAAPVSAEVAGHERVSNSQSQSYTAGSRYANTVLCSTGKVVLGGGFDAPTSGSPGSIVASYPVGDPSTGWKVEFIPSANYTGYGYDVYAICATP